MTIERKTTMNHILAASLQTHANWIRNTSLKAGFFLWHYFEMMLAMTIGATLFKLLVRGMPELTSFAIGLQPGTFLYISGISLAMMLVMVAWMIVRGHGWRHSAEMAVAMLVPVALVAVISMRKGDVVWFAETFCSAMCVGMLIAMLYRWNHFTMWAFGLSHHRGHLKS